MIPTTPQFNHIVAFEVSKHELVVHILPAESCERIVNTRAALRRSRGRTKSCRSDRAGIAEYGAA